MADRIVLDAGPLVALARADALDVLAAVPATFVAPVEVRTELEAGAARGHVVIATPSIAYLPLEQPLNPVALAELGAGEAAVIQLALEQRITVVGIDERKGRRAASAVGLKVTGTLGLLARAKTLGVLPAVRPIVERMQARGVWFDEGLVQRVLARLGER